MKRKINLKNKIFLLLILLLTLLLSGCFTNLEDFYIDNLDSVTLSVGDKYYLDKTVYYSSDRKVMTVDDNVITAVSVGKAFVIDYYKNKILAVNVVLDPSYITVNGTSCLKVNDTCDLNVVVSPLQASQEVKYESSDEDVLSVNENGQVTALSEGFAEITVTSKVKESVKATYSIMVQNQDLENYLDEIEFNVEDRTISDLTDSDFTTKLNAIINNAKQSVVGVATYASKSNSAEMYDFGSGILYKRFGVKTDGTIVNDIKFSDDLTDIYTFKYYCITTRNLISSSVKRVKIYLGEDIGYYEAKLVQKDTKIDIALLEFECPLYLSLMKLADSDDVEQGEIVFSIGHSIGIEYFRNVTMGVVSHTKRYVSTDTDGDDVSDWDSEYIQHDAAINSADNGGALVNLKGEMIALNSTKIADSTLLYSGMSFSIPSNLVEDIVSILETGNQPQRPLLGVTIVDVIQYYKMEAYYTSLYPGMASIPEGLEYGFYITEIVAGGVAQAANAKVGDIILEFNGVQTKYSYLLRAELGKFIIGSGQTAELKVMRNGEIISLYVTF